jgi:thioester reductase-like protein
MEKMRPTVMQFPPAVAQFLCSLPEDELPSLGGHLEFVSIGSGPVPEKLCHILGKKYQIQDVKEGYGTTEAGAIASDSWIVPAVVDKVRLRDPNSNSGSDTGEWLNKDQEGVVGELWIGDINTHDIVQLQNKGRQLRVIGRSSDVTTFKLPTGKWCTLIDIEDKIYSTCCPELFDDVMVWVNRKGMLVLLCSRRDDFPHQDQDRNALLQEVLQRANLCPDMCPKGILLTKKPFPRTPTMKVKRTKVIDELQKEADQLQPINDAEIPMICEEQTHALLDRAVLAARVLGRPVDPTMSFLENGGDSITVVQWLRELRNNLGQDSFQDWRSLLDAPLLQNQSQAEDSWEEDLANFVPMPPPAVKESAKHILLTGATGFFGRSVLKAILNKDSSTVVVCLVRESSKTTTLLDESNSGRMIIVRDIRDVSLELEYRLIIHLAANVNHVLGYRALRRDNVELTESLLRLGLAPMLYCSTLGTRDRNPPFTDGYTQSKWVGEQMASRSGGTCFWPPLLIWGNPRDWLTRLVRHCLKTDRVPLPTTSFGFVPACPVKVAAQDLLSGRPCSAWDLDLSELFLRLQLERDLQAISLESFVAELQNDPTSPAYPYLPLLEGKRIGNPRSAWLQKLPINWAHVWPVLSEADPKPTNSQHLE